MENKELECVWKGKQGEGADIQTAEFPEQRCLR